MLTFKSMIHIGPPSALLSVVLFLGRSGAFVSAAVPPIFHCTHTITQYQTTPSCFLMARPLCRRDERKEGTEGMQVSLLEYNVLVTTMFQLLNLCFTCLSLGRIPRTEKRANVKKKAIEIKTIHCCIARRSIFRSPTWVQKQTRR